MSVVTCTESIWFGGFLLFTFFPSFFVFFVLVFFLVFAGMFCSGFVDLCPTLSLLSLCWNFYSFLSSSATEKNYKPIFINWFKGWFLILIPILWNTDVLGMLVRMVATPVYLTSWKLDSTFITNGTFLKCFFFFLIVNSALTSKRPQRATVGLLVSQYFPLRWWFFITCWLRIIWLKFSYIYTQTNALCASALISNPSSEVLDYCYLITVTLS